jgi:hypothetical protein
MMKASQMSKAGKNQHQESGLGPLIERLGPLNNNWRDGSAQEKVLTLWDMGDVILELVPEPSDALLWDIQSRSYLTRSLLRYALIVRRGWEQRRHLEELVKGLTSYTVFREALPFLKGDRKGIDDKTYQKVETLLRDPDKHTSADSLRNLKGKVVGRRHSKGGSTAAIREQAILFRQLLAQLESEVAQETVLSFSAPPYILRTMSQMALALATGDGSPSFSDSQATTPPRLAALADPMVRALNGGQAYMSAFRKVAGGGTLMRAADLLNSLSTETALADWRNRHRATTTSAAWQNTLGIDG